MAGRPKKPLEVHVYIKGGVVDHVTMPTGVYVIVHDRDVEGTDPDRVVKGEDGQFESVQVWGECG